VDLTWECVKSVNFMIIGMTVIYLQGAMFFMDTYKPKVFQYVKPSSLGIDTVF